MHPALAIALLWCVFAATHMTLASVSLRPRLVARLGTGAYTGLYSVVALATFVPMVSLYFAHKHEGPHFFYWGGLPAMREIVYLGMGYAFALMVAGLARPSPASLQPGKTEVAGVLRLTRHPLFMGVGIFGALHLLVASIHATELAFFAGFPLFAALGCWHQDQRKLATAGPDFAAFHASTRFLPVPAPAALVPAVREDLVPLLVGVAVAIGLRTFHATLFGGA
jgi:uncharacterized membrane protein